MNIKNNKKYKLVISIVFGLLGFVVNFYAVEVVELSKVGIKVNFLWGLIFPLIITLSWGAKYGFISAFAGGCQTMWWLWFSDGYGILYSVPMSTFWIVWHGYFYNYNTKENKWYLNNKYINEFIFRIIDYFGALFIFKYLISFNPPPWAPDINHTFVSVSWINSAVLIRMMSAYLLLIITDVLLNLQIVRKFLKLNQQKYFQKVSFVFYLFVLMGSVFWIGDTILDYIYFYDDSFFNLLLFKVPDHEFYVRSVFFIFCLVLGLITSSIISNKFLAEKKYKNLFNNLEDAVFLFKYDKEKKENSIKNKFIEVNKEAERLLGYNRKKLLSLSPDEISNIKKEEIVPKSSNHNLSKIEVEFMTKDNNKIPVEIKSNVFKLDEKEVVLAIARDITDRKRYEEKIKSQKEELQGSYEQLTAFSEEVVAINKELNQSIEQINNLNNRFTEMINIITDLGDSAYKKEEEFFSDLLQAAIEIVPAADYGKIFIAKDEQCQFIDAVGHELDSLTEVELKKDSFFDINKKEIYESDKHQLDVSKLSKDKKDIFKQGLKPIKKSMFINIKLGSETVGKIVLDIAKESNKEFKEEQKKVFESFSSLASAFLSFQRYDRLQKQFTEELVMAIIKMLEFYDRYTSGHSENVARLGAKIAEQMNLSQKEVQDTYWTGMVHDIGKLLIPLEILNKDSSLTDEEYNKIKKHPYWAYKALDKSSSLNDIAEYVLYHHERWDGKGYPEGIKGEEIPIVSQIITVVDAWDAMTSRRAYRDPLSEKEAIKEIKSNKGKQFSPKVVEAFLKLKGRG